MRHNLYFLWFVGEEWRIRLIIFLLSYHIVITGPYQALLLVYLLSPFILNVHSPFLPSGTILMCLTEVLKYLFIPGKEVVLLWVCIFNSHKWCCATHFSFISNILSDSVFQIHLCCSRTSGRCSQMLLIFLAMAH